MQYNVKYAPLLVLLTLTAEDKSIESEITRNADAATPTQKIDGIKINWKRLQAFYAARQFQPCWLNTSILHVQPFTSQAAQFAEALEHADEDGLLPQAYAANQLAERVKASPSADDNLMTELLLSDRAMQYISDLKTGRFSPKKIVPDIILPPRSIDIPALLVQALAANDVSATLRSFAPSHSEYVNLRKNLAEYHVIAAAGGWPQLPAGATLKPGMDDARIPILYERLLREGYLPGVATPTDNHYSDALAQGVEAFQRDHDLKPDGAIGTHTIKLLNVSPSARIKQIGLNMERWRWLPDDLGERHLLINIAGFNLEAIEDNHIVLQMRIIVGQEQHRTPVFSSTMSEVIFHPYWYAPKRLGEEDILPQLLKDPKSASNKGYEMLRVEDGEHTQVDLSTINLHKFTKADLKQYSFRQRPGPRNALGAIKFRVTNTEDIYLHDTSNPKLFSSDTRSLSNGCIRLAQPQALAEFVLRNVPDWPQTRIDDVYNTPVTSDTEPTAVTLPQPLPVHIMYLTARADQDGHLHFYDDVYKWDEKLEKRGL
jgi:murein L,D-transpeptidase YcbB/YkuD